MGGVGTCSRVWGHVAGGGGMTQDLGSCGRVWGHMAGYRCIWQGQMYVVGDQPYGIDGYMWHLWGRMEWCGAMCLM